MTPEKSEIMEKIKKKAEVDSMEKRQNKKTKSLTLDVEIIEFLEFEREQTNKSLSEIVNGILKDYYTNL